VNQHGLSRKHIFDAVKHSLERLQLEYIDVLQCHRFDPETPIEETVSFLFTWLLFGLVFVRANERYTQMQALHDVVQAGYVRYIGMSSCHAWQCTSTRTFRIYHRLIPATQSTSCRVIALSFA
jgi:aryl-alcohol dehydrogenase-like predicted oxidoreductase